VADVLVGYSWSPKEQRYRSGSTGRFTSRRDITNLLDTQVRGAEARLGELTTAYHEGRMTGVTFLEQFSTELRRAHSQNAALAAGGWDRMGPAEWGRVGGHLKAEYARAVEFAGAIERGEVTLPQALARSNMYAGSARVEFWEAQQANRPQAEIGMATIERRILGVAEHCNDCLGYYDRGWCMAGELPPPGVNSICRSNCKCVMLDRQVPASELQDWLGAKK